jgi:splicing factor 3A subunit 3
MSSSSDGAATEDNQHGQQQDKPFDNELKRATNAGVLEKNLTLQQLKEALEARGLKASGTAAQRSARLFAVKNLQPDQYPLELLKVTPSSNATASASVPSTATVKKEVERIKQALQRLLPIVHATQTMITKKLTMTYDEIEQELREEEQEHEAAVERSDDEADEDGDEEGELAAKAAQQHGVIDPSTGRIIPKWMYRFYGLNQEFRCEICGNQSYFGRRAYDRHFKDFKHSNGMRALGIPNTLHFHDITKIEDAKRLYASLRKELEKNEKQQEEEFEDSEGNVLSKSAYEDLKREGLL